MKVSIFLTSFFSTKTAGSKLLTSAAILAGKSLVSNRVMGPTPDLPLTRQLQVSREPTPNAVTRPTPVITTRRFTIRLSFLGIASQPHTAQSFGPHDPFGVQVLS